MHWGTRQGIGEMNARVISYHLSVQAPHRQFIRFEAVFPNPNGKNLRLQLPSWRPGRYELGLFARNVRGWKASDAEGKTLPFSKFSRDGWEVESEGLSTVRISYEYYAAELNAGSTFLDEEQVYINPVNCFFFLPDFADLPYRISLDLPEHFQIATGMRVSGKFECVATDFDELADCPLIASGSLQHLEYTCRGVHFHLWIQGEHGLDCDKLLADFNAFSSVQIDAFGSFPVNEYHFLFQLPPYSVRHGVEHQNSTVIAMGPATEYSDPVKYEKLLGISSHELYHTWNVKAIRPIEMQPYRFDRENYSTLGYVAEGVTTYYGDVMLCRARLISDETLLNLFSRHLDEHVNNPGRFSLSVADSSVDTWLDGYVTGVPGRKVSIYNEGCLIAWICDARILDVTNGNSSLDTLMRKMYKEFGESGIGYTGADYKRILEEVSGVSFDDVWKNLIHGVEDYSPFLQQTMETLGIDWIREPSPKANERSFGFSVDESGSRNRITAVVPHSPADTGGLGIGDEIVALNGVAVHQNIHDMVNIAKGPMILDIIRRKKMSQVELNVDGNCWKYRQVLRRSESLSEVQKFCYQCWTGV